MAKTSWLVGGLIAVSLAMAGVGYWQHTKPQRLYQKYLNTTQLNTFQSRALEIVELDATEERWRQASDAFHHKAYAQAAGLFESILATDADHLQANVGLGLAYLAEAQYEAAQMPLQRAYAQQSTLEYLDAAWGLALLALHDGDVAKARQLLAQINALGGAYQVQAREVLAEL